MYCHHHYYILIIIIIVDIIVITNVVLLLRGKGKARVIRVRKREENITEPLALRESLVRPPHAYRRSPRKRKKKNDACFSV